jgi:hypothetical protein
MEQAPIDDIQKIDGVPQNLIHLGPLRGMISVTFIAGG